PLCRQFFHRARRNVEHLLSHPHFELIRHDITLPLYVEVDQIYNLACLASPISLPTRSGANDKNEHPRCDQDAGTCETRAGTNSSGSHVGSLWRSKRSPTNRRLLGPRQPDQSTLLL